MVDLIVENGRFARIRILKVSDIKTGIKRVV